MAASPPFQVVEHESPDSYSSAARAFLIADEIVNGMPLGILEALMRDPSLYPGRRLFTVTALPPGGVGSSNRIVACGHWTPPHPLCLVMNAEEGEGPLISLVERVQAAGWRPAGVTGGIDVCQLFLDLWNRATGAHETIRRRQGLYVLTEVVASFLVDDGRRLRLACTDDTPWLQDWSMAFHIDCRLPTTPEACAALVARNLAQHTRWILEDTSGHALCMVGVSGRTPHGARVGWVYTPPAQRGKGHASRATALLSQTLLNEGARFCTLFTDLENLTSNSIYQAVGYRLVTTTAHVSIDYPA